MEKITLTSSGPQVPTSQPTNPAGSQPVSQAPQSPYYVPAKPTGTSMKKSNSIFIVLAILVIAAGVATGQGLGKLRAKSSSGSGTFEGKEITRVPTNANAIQVGQIFGSANETDFKDSAEGVLQLGGLDGEGSHKLVRAGGVSQTVYLTSSITDLNKFDGMKVKVWGETFKGQKAGWLMDVGRIEVKELKAAVPTE